MRHFFRPHRAPAVERLLLVESGSRTLIENLLPQLPGIFGQPVSIDLFTCFSGVPKGWSGGRIFHSANYKPEEARVRLYSDLRAHRYQVVGLICSGEPILSKWKWMLAYQLPARVFLLNENGDYVWIDREHLSTLWEFARFRSGLAGAGAVRTLARLLLLPFSLLFLLIYAASAHLGRWVRLTFR